MITPSARVPALYGKPDVLSEEWVRYLTVTLPAALGVVVYEVADLPSATSSAYTRAFVSDSNATTFAAVVAGGGADKVPVWSDGINWRIG